MKNEVLLPGGFEMLKFLESKISLQGFKVLIVGSSAENIAVNISEKAETEVIVEDYESLISANYILKNVPVKLMDFSITDYENNQFDLVYAQASISSSSRNKIFKEIKRILKPEGILCVGELILKNDSPPQFVKDILEDSNLKIFTSEDLEKYYRERNFKITEMKNLSGSLSEYYSLSRKRYEDSLSSLNENEKKYYKKLLAKISHETNAFLKLGADKFLGFKVFILRKGN